MSRENLSPLQIILKNQNDPLLVSNIPCKDAWIEGCIVMTQLTMFGLL